MKKVIYHNKEFPSQTKCIQSFDFTNSKIRSLAQNNHLTIEESLDVSIIANLFHLNTQAIISCNLYKNQKFLASVDEYVEKYSFKSSNKPIKKLKKLSTTNDSIKFNSKPFTYDGIYYNSAFEYCKKYNIKYNRLMKYINRNNCTTQEAIDALKQIDDRKYYLFNGKKFNIDTTKFASLEHKYGKKFNYYFDALVRENLQDYFKNLNLTIFLKFAVENNIKNTKEEMESLIKFLIENDLTQRVHNTELYTYNNVVSPSIRNLCEKLKIPYVTVIKRISTKKENYKDAIDYVLKNTRIYKYKGKTYCGFSNLCKDYNISVHKVLRISNKENISKMDAFLQIVES